MSVISLTFILFLLGTLIVYWLIPERFRNGLLLLASWIFVVTWDWRFLLFLIGQILVSFLVGKVLNRCVGSQNKRVTVLTAGLLLLLGVLVTVKYTNFPIQVLGISFFTFQTVSYVMDVYRGDMTAETDFITYALYVSFFPQLVAGPIAKAKEQIARYKEHHSFELETVEKALVLALYGLFMKMVIADRIAIFVNSVYDNMVQAGRVEMLLAIVLYSIQIYCDFAGYSLIALGIGRSFGIELPVNFKQPYLSKSIGEFWKKWHISLTSWFRDYLYFPLGGNRKGKYRTYLNILIVFAISGIWHGAGYTFLVWGVLHGILQVLERALLEKKKIGRPVTFLMVSVLWVFFRADSVTQALGILQGVFVNVNGAGVQTVTSFGLDRANLILLAIMIVVMIIVDCLTDKGYNLVDRVFAQKLSVRWAILYVLIFSILIFGIYGPGYDASNFIYNNF